MEKNQTINCSVCSCEYNEDASQCCSLKQIMVAPIQEKDTKEPDESMCASYRYCNH